jgi:CheY-like chemotaxis protein
VRADPAELKQVVINLALNALQAMADRTYAMLELTVEPVGEHAKLIVADNGIGIPAENLERIFDPFFTTKGPEHGTGLGLSVCFGIVRRHGGEIDVSSEPGAGATFTIVLPCDAMEAAVIAEPAPRSTGIDLPRPAPGARVLVVEDEPHVRRLIQTVLSSRFGCHVDTASHGVEAFELLAVQRYALVVSDVRMPTMNGTELYLWLREAQPLTARRFVFVTGYPGESHLERDIAQWNVPVLTKPFTVAQLCEQCAPFLDLPAEALVAASCA